MKTKYFKNIVNTVIFFGLLSVNTLAQSMEEVSLDVLIGEATANNSKIQEDYHKWKAEEYKIKKAKSLDDPIASYGYSGESVQTRTGPQEQKVGVSQKIPFPGKRKLKGKSQSKHAQMLKEKYEATKNAIIKEVKFVYYDLFWVDQAIQISEEEMAILEKLEKVSKRKYESNLVPQQNVVRLQVEISKIIQKIYMLKQNRESLAAKLNSLLNRNNKTSFNEIMNINKDDFTYELDDILSKAQGLRQELKSANLNVERAEYEKSLARMNYLPDFTVGAEFTEIGAGTTTNVDDGQDAWMARISVNVPIWFGKLKAQLNEKKEALKAAESKKINVGNQVDYEVQDIYYKINAYKDIVLLYESALMPQAQQAFDSFQIAFETGEVEFLDWLDAQRTNLQVKLAYYKSLVDYQKSIAYLERVVGGQL